MIHVGAELLHVCLWCPVLVCQHCSWAENGDIVIRHTVRDCNICSDGQGYCSATYGFATAKTAQ